MKILSIIVPCYNEEQTINIFYKELIKIENELKENVEFEIIFIDDGSTDKTLLEIKLIKEIDFRIKYISFSRNFGKESAIYAGLKKSKGDYVVLMDVDLQDPVELIPKMYDGIINGYDCVATRRITRKGEPCIRSFLAKCFYSIINKITKIEIIDGARDFRLMTRQVVDSVLSLNEYNRFSKGIFSWVGYKTKWIKYENIKRIAGKTKWSFFNLLLYSLEGIIAFSTIPLFMASLLGIILFIISFILIFIIIVKTLIWKDPVSGYPSLICIIIFLGGIQLFCLGILGQYLAKMYLELKKRPLFIIKEEN